MKKKLIIIITSLVALSCSENRVLKNQTSIKENLIVYKENLFSGIVFDVYENGQLKEEGLYKNGKKEGLHQEWYQNGQSKFKKNYIDGKQNGLTISWNKNGGIRSESNYKNGKLDGLWQMFIKDSLKLEKTYKDGLRIDK